MIALKQLEIDLKRDEGRRDKPYKDSLGVLTIGYGHNLEAEGLCEVALLAQLKHDIQTKSVGPLDSALPWWKTQPDNVQLVMANMCFNLGITRFMKFHGMINEIHAGNYSAAARHIRTSLYAKQVGQRAERLAKLLESTPPLVV